MTDTTPEILPLGVDAVLVRFANRLSENANSAALAFRSAVDAGRPEAVTETATSLTSVLVRFDPRATNRVRIEEKLRTLLASRVWYTAPLPEGRKLWRIPAVFGGDHGPQLEQVADAVGLSPDSAVADLAATDLRVMAIGFAPGQPYLGFLGEHWNIPRQTEVNPQVPQGAVVVAVRQVIPFANASPTGWWHIGQTAFRCYSRKGTTPIPLSAGDSVRFEPVSAADFARLQDTSPLGGATSEVIV